MHEGAVWLSGVGGRGPEQAGLEHLSLVSARAGGSLCFCPAVGPEAWLVNRRGWVPPGRLSLLFLSSIPIPDRHVPGHLVDAADTGAQSL